MAIRIKCSAQVMIEFRNFIRSQTAGLFAVDQFGNVVLRLLRCLETCDGLGSGPCGDEVNDFFIGSDHVFIIKRKAGRLARPRTLTAPKEPPHGQANELFPTEELRDFVVEA